MVSDSPQYALEALPARAEQVIWLPGALADIEALPEVFEEGFCEDLTENAEQPIYVQLPELARFAEGDATPEPLEVAEVLSGKTGFLIQAATPVKKYRSETACEYSWGYYRTAWLYAPCEAEIASTILGWANAWDEKFKAEYCAASATGAGQ